MSPGFNNNMESFKPPAPEVKATAPKIPEQPAPTPEYSPSVFKQMTEQSSAKVDNNQHRIFASADSRASQSAPAANLKLEKASMIFTTGGFDRRVATAKQKIINLGMETKARIQSLFGREPNPQTAGQERDEYGHLKLESLKIPPKPMVSEDRGFEPNRMIKKHNLFMNVAREDHRARVEEFKEKLGEQKEGLIAMQADIIKIIQENPDISIDDLKKAVEPKLEQAMANPEQKQALDKILGEYSKAHQTVQHYREIFPADNRLFMEIFGFWPTGQIEVVQGPMTLGFRCHSQQDFARAMTFNYGNGKVTPQEAEAAAKHVIGQKFGDTPSSITPSGLKDKIILVSEENEQREKQHFDGDTMTHEEQHAMNTLFKDYRPQFYKFEGLEGLSKLAPEAQQEKITNFLRYNREKIDNDKLHDEIIAQYAGIPMNPKDVMPLVTVLARTYRQNFYTTQAAKLKQQIEGNGANPQMTDECIRQVFEDELIGQTKEAVYSMVVLQDEGFSKSEIISAFETEPVAKWPQVSRRIIDHRRGEGPKTYQRPMSMATATPDSFEYDPDAMTVFTAAHERIQRSVSKIPEGENAERQGIKTGNVDVSRGFDSVDKIERFVAYLKKQGFAPENYLYSGFSSSSARRVRQTGTHSETGLIFCAPFSELTSTSDTNQNPLLTYAGAEGIGAVALYKPEFLEKDETEGAYVYRLKKGVTPEQAIEAIVRVKVD